jgi:hypothetical protein
MKRLSFLLFVLFIAIALMGCPLFFGQVATPVISPPDGSDMSNNSEVTISTSTAGAKIYYSTDGSTPTESSTLYVGSFLVDTGVAPPATIKAIAVSRFRPDSEVATASYTWGW